MLPRKNGEGALCRGYPPINRDASGASMLEAHVRHSYGHRSVRQSGDQGTTVGSGKCEWVKRTGKRPHP